jgi:hypothetical protein
MLDRRASRMLLYPDEDFLNEVIDLDGRDALRKIPPQSRQIGVESACWLACGEDGHDRNMTRLAGERELRQCVRAARAHDWKYFFPQVRTGPAVTSIWG